MFSGFFRLLAKIQSRYYVQIVALTLVITAIQAYGATQIHMETDFSKFQPPSEPAVILSERVKDTFAGQDAIFLVIEVEPDARSKNPVKDIRDPRVVRMLRSLQDEMTADSELESFQSIASGFRQELIPSDIRTMIDVFDGNPASTHFFNRDYTSTIAIVRANIGGSNDKAKSVLNAIQEYVDDASKPPGIRVTVTGGPSIRVLVGDIIQEDAVKTILLSSALILIVLVVIHKSAISGILVFNPLIYALIWTIGTMGWAQIPLSIVTAGLGAMILGLGVEYSVFFVSKYRLERRAGKTQEDAIFTALDEVGTAIVGSSMTTIIGFLALLLSMMPMMHDLGITLALGIFFCVVSSLLINPAFLVLEENVIRKIMERMMCDAEDMA